MQDLFQSGRIADIVIALMAIEAVALIAYARATGRGIPARQVLSNLTAGVCLFLALRLALTGAPWTWIGGALAASLAAHLADLKSRWNSG
ncbi:MAG: hypothetical protein ACT4OU_01350 [Hyphomicrobium sp.]